MSLAPPEACLDIFERMLYSADAGVGSVSGIKFDQATGAMTIQFIVDVTTLTFHPLIGPDAERALILSNTKGKLPGVDRLVEPLPTNSPMVPGYGRRRYYLTDTGCNTVRAPGRSKLGEVAGHG